MTQEYGEAKASEWRPFLKKHWRAFSVFIAAVVVAVAGAVYVFVWFTGIAQSPSTGIVPPSLGDWTMNNFVMFILNAIFWEIVIVGIPIAIGAVIAWQWWEHLPAQEKKEHMFGKSSKSRDAGGAISPLLFIAFALKVYIDGNWNQTISTYSLDYVVGSMVTILIWVAAIFAIPATAGIIWWIHNEMNKKP